MIYLICANAVGIYGVQENADNTELDEDSPIDFEYRHDFMSKIGIRCNPRLIMVLMKQVRFLELCLVTGKGILKKLSPSFYMGFGSVIGDGKNRLIKLGYEFHYPNLEDALRHEYV